MGRVSRALASVCQPGIRLPICYGTTVTRCLNVFSFLLHIQELAGIRLILAMVAYLFLTVLSIVAAVEQMLGQSGWLSRDVHLLIVFLGLAFVVPLFFLIRRAPSPGAGDNLNACAMAVKIAEHFASRKQKGVSLKHTRLILLSTDGEEVGQRGALAYAERHKTDLLMIPTYVLNIDSVYNLEDLAVLTRDRNGTLPLSARMAKECCELGLDLGYSIKELPLPLGGGGTDAAAFARIGVETTTIIGIPTAWVSSGLVYHTPWDTVEHIQTAAVEAVLDISINYVLRKDHEAG